MSCPNCPRCGKGVNKLSNNSEFSFSQNDYVCPYCGYGTELAAVRQRCGRVVVGVRELVAQCDNLPHQGSCEGPFSYSLNKVKSFLTTPAMNDVVVSNGDGRIYYQLAHIGLEQYKQTFGEDDIYKSNLIALDHLKAALGKGEKP